MVIGIKLCLRYNFARFICIFSHNLDKKDIPNMFGVSIPAYARLRVLFWSARVSVHDTVLGGAGR